MKTITIPSKTVTIEIAKPAIKSTITEFTIETVSDNQIDEVKAVVSYKNGDDKITKVLILWEGSEYDAIGDYTQSQIEAKILTLL